METKVVQSDEKDKQKDIVNQIQVLLEKVEMYYQ